MLYSLSAWECLICVFSCFGFLHHVSLMARMWTLVLGFELYSLSRVSIALSLLSLSIDCMFIPRMFMCLPSCFGCSLCVGRFGMFLGVMLLV